MYYYHEAKLISNKLVVDEIDSLQNATNGNKIYFEELKKYFSDLNFSMSVPFE